MATYLYGETYFSTNEAIAHLKISRTQFYRLLNDGRILKSRIGTRERPLYKKSTLDKLLHIREEQA